ncbi:hypothetical protein CEXT_231121 [Caerostris extrusa]|uniref:Uncharacterized protein n=1 Tax=Caerostris extrusa TaxID=172846 RepID=A0AAV4R2Z5_CAEEX|nr:hypothetical protein CEXT_231121 [Caerostris extrusa]
MRPKAGQKTSFRVQSAINKMLGDDLIVRSGLTQDATRIPMRKISSSSLFFLFIKQVFYVKYFLVLLANIVKSMQTMAKCHEIDITGAM